MKKKEKILFILLIIIFLISLFIGRYPLSINAIMDAIMHPFRVSMEHTVFYNVRLPRIFFVVLCGGVLALSGSTLQSIFKNPLVSGDVLGVSSGCSIGAILAILWNQNTLFLSLFSFVGGMIAMYLTIQMASSLKGNKTLYLILSGIVVSAFANAVIMGLKLVADPYQHLPTIEFWLMGGFSNLTWKDFIYTTPIMFVCSFLLYKLRYQVFVLSLGEEEASSLGMNVKRMRFLILILTTLLISSVVSVCGIVSWIGLMAPHIAYMMNKKSFHHNFLMTFMVGSLLLLVADNIARSVFTMELPISILTSIMGAIVLWYLLKQRKIQI